MKNLHAIIGVSLGLLATSLSAQGREIEGVTLAPTKTVDGQSLSLNGAGVRSIKLAFVPIKVYVAALYSPQRLSSASAVMNSDGPLQMDFTFLRAADQGQVDDGWNEQFEFGVTDPYAGFESDRKAFVALFDPIGKMETQRVVLAGDETKVYQGGKLKGSVEGRDFQRAFLSLFFGPKPATETLKSQLLGQ